MGMNVIQKKSAYLKDFFGVPVLVQLHAPLAIVSVSEKTALPYSDKPEEKQWIPGETMNGQEFVTVQVMKYAVLREFEGSDDCLEMSYVVPGPQPGTFMQLGTLVAVKNIAYVTRVVFVPEGAPSVILKV